VTLLFASTVVNCSETTYTREQLEKFLKHDRWVKNEVVDQQAAEALMPMLTEISKYIEDK
jgi:hypothetical protein